MIAANRQVQLKSRPPAMRMASRWCCGPWIAPNCR